MPTFTDFDGLRIQMKIEKGDFVVQLLVPRGAGLPDQVLSKSSMPLDVLAEYLANK